MYPVQSILPTTVILHNPQANLLSRDCKTLLNSEYITEERVLGKGETADSVALESLESFGINGITYWNHLNHV